MGGSFPHDRKAHAKAIGGGREQERAREDYFYCLFGALCLKGVGEKEQVSRRNGEGVEQGIAEKRKHLRRVHPRPNHISVPSGGWRPFVEGATKGEGAEKHKSEAVFVCVFPGRPAHERGV
ncbi:hypothetical protein HPB51_029632 [Rhipicephalus microplus]|uniref:Uncharacterized protein n=1 Tax=Rhipicephalus microplus TaxID=6941 RepID=A0A9J6CUB0_RHIMP|nr:hypothetical protein HPB51_029632 [Rhipicephalus microplus]